MSEFADARDELLDANDEAVGSPQTAKVGGKVVRCIIEEMSDDEILVAGGTSQSGGQRLSCIPKESLMPQPDKGTEVIVNGQEMELLTIAEKNDATLEILAGSLLRDER